MDSDLVERARQTGTAALLVTKQDGPVVEWVDEGGRRPIETMSVTKMVVATVCGAAFATEAPEVLDASVARWVGEWADDPRSAITLAQLLGHTSGLEVLPTPEILEYPSAAHLGLLSELRTEPGHVWAYNNSAFNLVGLIVKRQTGLPVQEFAAEALFGPLRFGEWSWRTDEAGSGLCHFGLAATATDLAKIGDLMPLSAPDDVVPRWWIEQMRLRSLSCYPQAAWVHGTVTDEVIDGWTAAGVGEDLVSQLEPLRGRRMEAGELVMEMVELLGGDFGRFASQTSAVKRFEQEAGPIVGYGHDGDQGQWLVVMPGPEAVGVRLRDDFERGSSWSSFPGDAHEAAA